MSRFLYSFLILAAVVLPAAAQPATRRATMTGSRGDRGKCTIEVDVDDVVEVDIRGDQGRIRTLTGQPSEWRRFECTDPLPPNPSDFKFTGVDGRGRQTLAADPRENHGVAVIRIEDPKGGREGYTFDIEWRGRLRRGGRLPDMAWDNAPGAGPASAVDACRDAVREKTRAMGGDGEIEFTRTNVADNPDRRDLVIGTVLVRRGDQREELHYQCSVDLQSGRIRSVDVNRGGELRGGPRGPRFTAEQALRICQDAVADRIRSRGYDKVNVFDIRADDNPGRNDWVIGQATGQRESRGQSFDFSCSVDFESGRVRSVDVQPR